MRRIPALLVGLLGLVATGNTVSAAPPADASRPVRIGFSMDTLKEERWHRDKSLVEQSARDAGATITVKVANGDDALQKKQAEEMLAQGIDVLIIAPHSGVATAPIVEAAHKKGVPVVAYDRMIRNANVDLYVAHQAEHIGEMQSEYALAHAPRGNYLLIGGSPNDNNALLLRKGQMKILKPAIDRGDIRIVAAPFAAEWKTSEARRITEEALAASKDLKAIVASNDGTAAGAILALDAAGLAGKVLVTGQDAEKEAVQRIVKGTQTMTIYKAIQPLAATAVGSAIKLARKQHVATTDKINNGLKDIPSILLAPTLLDRTNVDDTVIKDGYHKRADIYGK